MSHRFKFAFRLFGLLAIAIGLLGAGIATAAEPSDGRYDIALLDVGASGNWSDETFSELSEPPGVFKFDWTLVQPNQLSSHLDEYDVLIIPYDQEDEFYDWLTPSIKEAIVRFVEDGGTLIIHAPRFSDSDPLLAAFGSGYRAEWVLDDADEGVMVIEPGHPLVNRPNKLSEESLNGWGNSFHSFLTNMGGRWEDAVDSPGGVILTCATYGAGSIVLSGFDPESHGSADAAHPMVENEVTAARSALCEGDTPSSEDERNRFLGGGLVGAFPAAADQARENRERANAAGAAAAAAAVPAPTTATVRPPSTGDGGLR